MERFAKLATVPCPPRRWRDRGEPAGNSIPHLVDVLMPIQKRPVSRIDGIRRTSWTLPDAAPTD
jgi:hypothetical protein